MVTTNALGPGSHLYIDIYIYIYIYPPTPLGSLGVLEHLCFPPPFPSPRAIRNPEKLCQGSPPGEGGGVRCTASPGDIQPGIRPASSQHLTSGQHPAGIRPASGRHPAGIRPDIRPADSCDTRIESCGT